MDCHEKGGVSASPAPGIAQTCLLQLLLNSVQLPWCWGSPCLLSMSPRPQLHHCPQPQPQHTSGLFQSEAAMQSRRAADRSAPKNRERTSPQTDSTPKMDIQVKIACLSSNQRVDKACRLCSLVTGEAGPLEPGATDTQPGQEAARLPGVRSR